MTVPTLHLTSVAPANPLRLEHTTRLTSTRPLSFSGVAGWAWITLDGDPRDIVLGSGERLTVPPHRRVTVTALRPGAHFALIVAPTAAPRPLTATLVDALRAAWRTLAPARRAARGPGWSA